MSEADTPSVVPDGAQVRPRSYPLALGSLALGALLLFLASSRTWATVVVSDPGLPTITVVIPGRELTFGAPLALLALAATAGLIALRRVGRMVAGLVLLGCALPALVSVVVFASTHDSSLGAGDWIANIASERAGVAVSAAGTSVTLWWVVEVVGVLLVVMGAVLAVVASRDWPTLGNRYERSAGASATAAASGSRAAPAPEPGSAWDQLDRGIDPTAAGPDAPLGADPPS